MPVVLTTSVRASECSDLQLVIGVLTAGSCTEEDERRAIELLQERVCSRHADQKICPNNMPDGVHCIGTCSKVPIQFVTTQPEKRSLIDKLSQITTKDKANTATLRGALPEEPTHTFASRTWNQSTGLEVNSENLLATLDKEFGIPRSVTIASGAPGRLTANIN